MENLLKGRSRSKSCSIRQPARKRRVLTIGRVHASSVGGRKKNGRAVGVRWQSSAVKTDSRKEVDDWIFTWHISYPSTPFQQSISLTTLFNIQAEWPFSFPAIIQSGIDFMLVIYCVSFFDSAHLFLFYCLTSAATVLQMMLKTSSTNFVKSHSGFLFGQFRMSPSFK